MEVDFVGRRHYLIELRKAFQRYPVTSVCGLKTVGKSRLVSEFLSSNDFQKEHKDCCIIHTDMHHHGDKESLYSYLCSKLDVFPVQNAVKTNDWINHIVLTVQKNIDQEYLAVFDNAEDAVEEKIYDGFMNLVHSLIKHCTNIKIIVTSTTNLFLATVGRSHYVIELWPLQPFEARTLLKLVTTGVNIGDEEMNALVELSDGLPLLLLMIGSELTDTDRGISPAQMVEMLAEFRLEATSQECYPPERRAADVYTKFIQRLSEIHQSRLAILNFIPGTFDVREAREMLDENSNAETKLCTLQPMIRRHVMYNKPKWRFDIHGILRECMDTFPKMKNLPEIQTRYYRLFSDVMTEVCRKFGTAEYTKALAEFSVEQPNFTKLLASVSKSSQDDYKFFIQVARNCSYLIEQYMPGLSDDFYKGCLTLAERHGQTHDKAAVYVAIGSLSTNGKGNFAAGEGHYKQALTLLEKNGKSVDLMSLYNRLGWNLHSQGRNTEALWYLNKAMEISIPGHPEYRPVMMQTLGFFALVNNWIGVYNASFSSQEPINVNEPCSVKRGCNASANSIDPGNYNDAKKYAATVLEDRKQRLGERHPHYAEQLNQMGLIHDNIGQPEEAMKYFEKALDVKRQSKTTIYSMTVSLSNMANKYRVLKQFDKAKELLDEAMGNIQSSEQKHQGGLSLIHNSYGKLYRDMQMYKVSDEHFTKSMNIRQFIIPGSIPYVWTTMQLAQVKASRKKYRSAIKLLDDILNDKDHVLETMPHNDFVYEVLKTKSEIYLEHGHMEAYKDILNEMLLELARLLNIHMERENDIKYALVCGQWEDVKQKLEAISSENHKS